MRRPSARYARWARSFTAALGLGWLGCSGGKAGGPGGSAGDGTVGGNATSGEHAAGGNAASSNATNGEHAAGGNAASSNATAGGNAASNGGHATAGDAAASGKATGGAHATDGGNTATGGALDTGGAPAAAGLGGGMEGGHGGAGGAGGIPGGGAGSAGSWPSGDEFEGTALDESWTVLRPDLADLALADGALSITPKPKDLWYQASQGVLVYQLVTGDFKATATVHARKASDRSLPPTQFADVGGLMARNPTGDSENYVLGVVGYAEMDELAIEHKSTTNSQSEYGETAFSADAELRLCRTGASFTIYYRHPGDSGWPTSVAPIVRADLPATLQVGMIAYTGASAPDYVSSFERIAFEPVGAACDE